MFQNQIEDSGPRGSFFVIIIVMRNKVHYEETGTSKPRPHERKLAETIAECFQSDIIFLRRRSSQTPDIYVLKTNLRWELKSPIGRGKRTIQNNLRGIERQSENVIIDLSRSKLSDDRAVSRAKEFLRTERNRIKRLKILLKTGEIIDIKG